MNLLQMLCIQWGAPKIAGCKVMGSFLAIPVFFQQANVIQCMPLSFKVARTAFCLTISFSARTVKLKTLAIVNFCMGNLKSCATIHVL
jgi:hypothetical protein